MHNEAVHNVEWASGYAEHERVYAQTSVYIPETADTGTLLSKTVSGGNHYINGGQEKILAEEVPLPYVINYTEKKMLTHPCGTLQPKNTRR